METILSSEEGTKFLLGLPVKEMISICESDKLIFTKPDHESLLVKLFEKYLKHRDTLTLLPEEDPSKNIDVHLSEIEREGRKKLAEDKKVEE
jgi:hypothetical protein